MANTLRFKRGLVATIPTALAGEPLFTTDTFDLYIGNGTTNTRFQKYIASGTTSQLLRGDGSLLTMPIVLTSPATGQVLKFNGTNWVNDSDAGITGSLTTNYLPKATGATTLTDSSIFDNGTSVGIGTTSVALYNLRVARTMTSSNYVGIAAEGIISNTTIAYYFSSLASTTNAVFTVSNLYHFAAAQGTRGASSTITSQFGFFVDSTLVGATNNYGFYGNIASGTNRWNLYMNGTALNYMNGALLLGSTTSSGEQLQVTGTMRVTGASTLNSTLTLSSTGSTFIVLDNTTATTGRQWRASAAGNGRFFLTNVTDAIDVLTLQTTGAATFNSSVTSTAFIPSAATIPTNGMYLPTTNTLGWSTNSTERLRLDASGNLGLAVTPSAWGGTSLKALEVNAVGNSLVGLGNGDMILMSNAYFNSGFKYAGANNATSYRQQDGVHKWSIAPLGSTGGTITFTQAMTLDASGNLMVGSATSSGERLQVTGTAKITGATTVTNTITATNLTLTDAGGGAISNQSGNLFLQTSSSGGWIFRINASPFTERMRLNSAGDLGINTDSPAAKLHVVGNAIVTGNLTVDTNTLFVDATNNRVGVGTATPSVPLDVVGAANFSSTIAVGGTATFLNPSSVNIVGTATLVGATARNTSSASGNTQCGFYLENGTSNGQLYKAGTGYTTLKTIAANDLGFYNAAAGNISILNDFASGSIILTAGGSSTAQWTIGANGDLTAADGENIIVGSTNGTKIGTAATQKLGFWNATPIAQPNNSVAAANYVAGIGSAVTTLDAFDGYTIGQVVKALRNAGILS